MYAGTDIRNLDRIGIDIVYFLYAVRLSVDQHRVRFHIHVADDRVLRPEFKLIYRPHRYPCICLERETEKQGVGKIEFKGNVFSEYQVRIFLKLVCGNIEHLASGTVHLLEIDTDGETVTENAHPHDIVSGSTAPRYDLTASRRHRRVPLDIAAGHHRHLQIIDIVKGKIVQEPDTESQQERKQKHRQIPPVDIEFRKQSGQQFLHPLL